jgi:O-acetyl-ADP-ribose deacetylase (regulator of RNase III)
MAFYNKVLSLIEICQGDITLSETEAIVNAANTTLLGGGGVDGAIHRAAGPKLLEECRTLNGCKTGEAKITAGYNLKSKYVIHTPGPVYHDGRHGENELLTSCYRNCMILAKKKSIKSISFPAISTGVYGYPKNEACSIALETIISTSEILEFFPVIHFILFDKDSFEIYRNTISEISSKSRS